MQSETPDVSGEAVQDAEDKVEFLNREVQYSQRLYEILKRIGHVNAILSRVEQAIRERRILDALHLVEGRCYAI
jgi:centromere/kinetochore protein ZW10